jgi:hypothetical protein
LPHPDDVVFEPDKPVYFIGPSNDEEAWRLGKLLALRDLLLMQAGYERRLDHDPDADEIIDTPYLFATCLNASFPARHQRDIFEIEDIVRRYFCTSKRALLPRLRRAWREFGIARYRGWVMPSLGYGRTIIQSLLNNARFDRNCSREFYMSLLRLYLTEDKRPKE